MFDPFAEKAFDAHSVAMLRPRPKMLANMPPRQAGLPHEPQGHGNRPLAQPLVEPNEHRAANETLRKK
ncbi:MAG: hypothetical protein M1453_05005 [Acidobacteria bacterium]|nr:hypothetical protein [Acidobacteriota bacterium]MCL5287338.1 hypothetical protein [Acidobacteriota bacterium]